MDDVKPFITDVNLGWFHDPTFAYRATQLRKGNLTTLTVNDWTVSSPNDPTGFDRCGIMRGDRYDQHGSCGLPPGHETPHCWLRFGYTATVSRRRNHSIVAENHWIQTKA